MTILNLPILEPWKKEYLHTIIWCFLPEINLVCLFYGDIIHKIHPLKMYNSAVLVLGHKITSARMR